MKMPENMLARYSILHELGHGATGRVYAARDRETGAVVALKRLDPALSSKCGADFVERFLKHARSAQLLEQRNIVRIHEAGKAAGTAYVAMELLEGENLRKILDDGPLPIARAIRIAHDIASGLAHAHLEGVVHGGLTPSNVIVLRSGEAKITDFGIGLLAPASQLSGAPAGSPSYLSPEQVRGEPVDHRCDIFALGALFYEMLTQRPVSAEPPAPSELNPHLPRALDGIIFSMLARQPASRMAGIPILLRELERLEEGLGLGSAASAGAEQPRPSAPPADPEPALRMPDANPMREAMEMMDRESRQERPSGSRRAIFAALTVVLAVLGIGLAGFMYYSPGLGKRITASRTQETPATVPEVSGPTAPAPVVEAAAEPATAMPPKPPAAEPASVARTETPVRRASEQLASTGAAPQPERPQAMQPKAKVPEPQPGGTARLILAVSPRGEIYIDGKHHGAAPPLTTFDLEPGLHRIEVRSGSRTPYLTYMMVQAGDVRRIQHDFDTSRAVHPPRSASWQSSKRAAR